MGVFNAAHRLVDAVREMPGVQQSRQRAYERQFRTARAAHLFLGRFESFDEALRAAPPTAPMGYDNQASTDHYLGRDQAQDTDYPALFWLAQGITQHGLRRVVDLGGNVGNQFLALRAMMSLPQDLQWLVIDVPQVVQRGQQLWQAQAQRGAAELAFSTQDSDIEGADLLFVSGALQYLPETLAQKLMRLSIKPPRIVVNTTPIHPTTSFFTLNSIGSAYCPYRVQSRAEFVGGLAGLGYSVRDSWLNRGKGMHIPFVNGCDVEDYSGFCFELGR
jgi:putative methyltransferase (TIGR04325 family)